MTPEVLKIKKHPDRREIAEYAKGWDGSARAAAVGDHIAGCSTCAGIFAFETAVLGLYRAPEYQTDLVLNELFPARVAGKVRMKTLVLRYCAAACIALVLWGSGFFAALAKLPFRAEKAGPDTATEESLPDSVLPEEEREQDGLFGLLHQIDAFLRRSGTEQNRK